MAASPARTNDLRLAAYVVCGLVAGAVYVVFDVVSEARLERGTLTGVLARAHGAVDHLLPLVAGALFGVCAHYFKVRERLGAAEEAAGRAEALRIRLQKVERDQAVWVLAAAVLHELNNPLHALGLLLDELASFGGDSADRTDLIERARVQADRALSQLRTLRSMRSVEEPRFEMIQLDRIVGALANDVGTLVEEEGFAVSVECAEPVHASGDPTYVRTIVENLLDNSLHSLRGSARGHIVVRLSAEGGRAVVSVSDDGPPLDPAARDALFEPLGSTKTRGLGLGLPIARALARAMRGDVTLDDAPPKTFRLELPLGSTAGAAELTVLRPDGIET